MHYFPSGPNPKLKNRAREYSCENQPSTKQFWWHPNTEAPATVVFTLCRSAEIGRTVWNAKFNLRDPISRTYNLRDPISGPWGLALGTMSGPWSTISGPWGLVTKYNVRTLKYNVRTLGTGDEVQCQDPSTISGPSKLGMSGRAK